MLRIKVIAIILLLAAPIAARAAAVTQAIDPEKSVITVRVFKTGLFSAFAHDHEIRAPIRGGSFSQEPAAVSLVVDARQMKVMDKGISEKDRAEIQETMLGPKVLDAEKFPEIRFESRQVERLGEGKWRIQGDLTVRDQTRPVQVTVSESGGHYRGTAEIRQKDFGITPVSVAGGAVKTKNELRLEFEVVGK
jgi:polyisoprenoid-binding protein YceI